MSTDPLAELIGARDAKADAIGRGMATASIAIALARATEDRAQAFADQALAHQTPPTPTTGR